MKLAEALKKRKVLRETLGRLIAKATNEAYSPDAKPGENLKSFDSVANALATLSADIASVNASVHVESKFGPISLLQARAIRDELIAVSKHLTGLASIQRQNVVRGGTQYDEASGRNVKVPDTVQPCCLDLENIYQRANQAARDARDLDSLLQAANWSTEVTGTPDEV